MSCFSLCLVFKCVWLNMLKVLPSQPGVGQFTPSNFIAVATATAALCCSMVPPFSRTLILFLFAIGHPEALEDNKNKKRLRETSRSIIYQWHAGNDENSSLKLYMIKRLCSRRKHKTIKCRRKTYLTTVFGLPSREETF